MKIMWVTNIPLPEASTIMGETPTPFGGWLLSAAKDISKKDDILLSVAFPKTKINNIQLVKGKKINYYVFPRIKNKINSIINSYIHFEKMFDDVKPDIVHIFGTEYAHSLAIIRVCNIKRINVVVSIQGLVSAIAKHYMANLPSKIQKNYTFRDLLKWDNLEKQSRDFERRGMFEIETIKNGQYFIGRTTWDRAYISQINPQAFYYFCNETLRDEFYKNTWSLDNCIRHTIFISQASYPLKGLHYILEAMPTILKKFPETILYVAGHNITKSDTIFEKLKIKTYGKYIKELISKYALRDHVIFTGVLDEKQICKQYLKANVFVCPSSIENSPNSLGEAMLLGLPCVASYVGGIPDLLKDKEEGFIYQTDAPYMLAYYVCEIFSNDALAKQLSSKARERALKTHDRVKNTEQLIAIYNEMRNQIPFNQGKISENP